MQNFPPTGGAGVQRSVKFVKYLPNFGFLPIVVTCKRDKECHWTPEDRTMLNEIPDTVQIFRSSSRNSIESLSVQVIKKYKPDLIFVSMSPFSDSFIAEKLSRVFEIPWIADLRDPWALDEFQTFRSRWHRLLERRKMFCALKNASLIIMNTPQAAIEFRIAFPRIKRERVTFITNGFDKNDFQESSRFSNNSKDVESNVKFRIVHSGYLHTENGLRQLSRRWEYKILGRTIKGAEFLGRSHYYLIKSLEELKSQDDSITQQIQLILAGKLTKTDKAIIDQSSIRDIIQTPGYLDHNQSVALITRANLLFLPMHNLPNNNKASIVPGKTYEYMATGNPILAAVPEGDAKDFLTQCGTATTCVPTDVNAMVRIIDKRYAEWKEGATTPTKNWDFISRFERTNLTRQLADVIKRVENRP